MCSNDLDRIPLLVLHYNSTQKLTNLITSFDKYEESKKFFFLILDNASYENEINSLNQILEGKNTKYLSEKEFNGYSQNTFSKEFDYFVYFNEKNKGYSAGNNQMVELLQKHKYKNAILLNPDIILIEKDSLTNLVKLLESNKNIAQLYPSIIDTKKNHVKPFRPPSFYFLFYYKLFFPFLYLPTKIYMFLKYPNISKRIKKIYDSIGCIFAINLELFKLVDNFDEDFFLYWEEPVMAEKFISAKKIVGFTNTVNFFHDHDYNMSLSNNKHFIQSKYLFYTKYKGYNDYKIELMKKVSYLNRKTISNIFNSGLKQIQSKIGKIFKERLDKK